MSVTQTLKALDTALEASLPKHAQSAVCVIPKQARFAFEQEASAVQQAGDYRQREFAAGRICARSAISKLGIKSGPITMDEDGLPRWPEGVLAAISHSRGYCSAIATSDTYYRALGLDLEKTNRLSPAAIERVVLSSKVTRNGPRCCFVRRKPFTKRNIGNGTHQQTSMILCFL